MIPPKQNAAFVAAMEDVLAVYTRPPDAKRPLVCLPLGICFAIACRAREGTWAKDNMTRTHGRALRGERLVAKAPHGRWHLMGAGAP